MAGNPVIGQPPVAPSPGPSPLDLLSRNITTIGGIVAAVFAINTGLTTCTADQVAKYTAFHNAVATEESYWKTLYADYQATFSTDAQSNAELRDAKRLTIAQLSTHVVPSFSEFGVPDADKKAAHDEFENIKQSLVLALRTPSASGVVVTNALAIQDFAAGEQTTVRSQNGAVAAPTDATGAQVAALQPADATAVQTTATTVLSPGAANGWDVDVFWCQSDGGTNAYIQASAVAGALATNAKAGTPIAANITLGRIRLRPLPAQINAQSGYQIHDNIVRGEQIPAEQQAATAILNVANKAQSQGVFALSPSSSRTPWYISVFVCKT